MIRWHINQARINAFQLQQFRENVVAPLLERLVPIPRERIGGPKQYIVQIARDNSHNGLCYDARLAMAMTVGATFERQLRFWLSLVAAELRPSIERADFLNLLRLLRKIANVDLKGYSFGADLEELWEIVNVARHGDGAAARKLAKRNPSLWAHNSEDLQQLYNVHGLRAETMRVSNRDLERYIDAAQSYWREMSRHPFRPRTATRTTNG